jgi:ubiquinone/menaquinone biosynthesis C-methylase UbiE
VHRLKKLGAARWPCEARVVEICCGRGNGLRALERLSFSRLEGVDLSATLLNQYAGPARVYVGDCRQLPFEDDSRDLVIVQGGLHHLPALPEDLAQTLAESRRVLKLGGRFVAVEPWRTPFLTLVHAVCHSRLARRLSPRIDALATMIRHEEQTYRRWLERPGMIEGLLRQVFSVERWTISWGKLLFVGRKGDRC